MKNLQDLTILNNFSAERGHRNLREYKKGDAIKSTKSRPTFTNLKSTSLSNTDE